MCHGVFRTALKSFKSSTRLLQVLVSSNGFQRSPSQALQEFKSLHIDIFVDNKHPSQTMPTAATSTACNVRLNLEDATPLAVATEGRDGGATKGMVRAMHREYVSWTIWLVIFPESIDEQAREEFLEKLPVEL